MSGGRDGDQRGRMGGVVKGPLRASCSFPVNTSHIEVRNRGRMGGGRKVNLSKDEETGIANSGHCVKCNVSTPIGEYVCRKCNNLLHKFCYACENYTTWNEEKRFVGSRFGIDGGSARWGSSRGFIYNYKCKRCSADKEYTNSTKHYSDIEVEDEMGELAGRILFAVFVLWILTEGSWVVCCSGLVLLLILGSIDNNTWRETTGNLTESDWSTREYRRHRSGYYVKKAVRRWKEVKDPTQDDVELLELQIKILKKIYSEAVVNDHQNSMIFYKNKLIDLTTELESITDVESESDDSIEYLMLPIYFDRRKPWVELCEAHGFVTKNQSIEAMSRRLNAYNKLIDYRHRDGTKITKNELVDIANFYSGLIQMEEKQIVKSILEKNPILQHNDMTVLELLKYHYLH